MVGRREQGGAPDGVVRPGSPGRPAPGVGGVGARPAAGQAVAVVSAGLRADSTVPRRGRGPSGPR